MFSIERNIASNIPGNIARCGCLYFPPFSKAVAGNLLSVDGPATPLPAILLAVLLDVNAP